MICRLILYCLFIHRMGHDIYIFELPVASAKYWFIYIYCISLYILDYIVNKSNFYTSQHIQLLTGCLLFPVLPYMLIKCIKAPVCYQEPNNHYYLYPI